MKKSLEITLHSDLCAGIGKHFAAMIDLDTALDDYGIPYIPSRRLKGCMREVAEFIECKNIDGIFGTNGSRETGSLHLGNAVIKDYQKVVSEIRSNHISHAEITGLYCTTKAQTAIDDKKSTAKDKSLRFIRVVNKHLPFSNEKMRFYAEIEFDEEYYDDIKNICLGLRNIGYQRNRGLGAVECSLKDSNSEFHFVKKIFEDNVEYQLEYLVELDSDLMIPANDSNHSLDYIPGTSVLGALAANYKGDSFNDIFLSGKARFSNLYVSDYMGNDYIPAPRFLARIKSPSEEEKGIKNTIGINIEKSKENNSQPPQYKILKHGYINEKFGLCEPESRIVYHNRVNGENNGLYMQYCLCEGQYFKGSVIAQGSLMRELYPLFSSGSFRFGRSKTAQYSRCRLVNGIKIKEYIPSKIELLKGTPVAFVLKSDVVITNSNGCYSTTKKELVDLIKGTVVNDDNEFAWDSLDDFAIDKTSLSTRVISGYNAKWNMKKPHIIALKAGSVVVARVSKDVVIPEEFVIGERQNEGFGVVRVISNADKYKVGEETIPLEKSENTYICTYIEKQRKNDEIVIKGVKKAESILLNASQSGRIILMCKESNDIDDFVKRLQSIKTESISKHALSLFSKDRINEELGEEITWEEISKYIITALNIRKYILRQREN